MCREGGGKKMCREGGGGGLWEGRYVRKVVERALTW